jgi:hypothetical protein
MKLSLLILAGVICRGQVSTDTTFGAATTYSYALSTFNTINPNANFDMMFLPSGYTPNGSYFSMPATMTYTSTPCTGSPSNGCVRDPAIGKLGSTWWVPYTCVGETTPETFCMTSTTTLANALSGTSPTWSATAEITIPGGLTTAIAPEFVRNPDGTMWLSSSTGCPSVAFIDTDSSTFWRFYETHPTGSCTTSTNLASATWSSAAALVTTGDSSTVLDPYIVCIHGSIAVPVNCTGTSDMYYMWYIHLISVTSEFIQYSSSSTLTGTYTKISANGDWMGLGGTTQEGPKIITFGGNWRFFYDRVQGVPGDLLTGQMNWADSTDNWATFPNAKVLVTQQQAKHGTVIPYP